MNRKIILIFSIVSLCHIIIIALFICMGKEEKEIQKNKQRLDEMEHMMQEQYSQLDYIYSSQQKTGDSDSSGQNIAKDLQEETKSLIGTTSGTHASLDDLPKPYTVNGQAATSSSNVKQNKTLPESNGNTKTEAIPQKNLSVPVKSYTRTPMKKKSEKLIYTNNTLRGAQKTLKGTDVVKNGILVDMDNMTVLWAKNETKTVPIASMTKIMTMLLAYEIAYDNHSPYSLSSKIPVTMSAVNTEPSKVYLKIGEVFTLKELLMACAVRSANDAAEQVANHLGGGDTNKFVQEMNQRAIELGMNSTLFSNPHGLPAKTSSKDNHSSMEDLVRLCKEFRTHEELVEWTSTRTMTFRDKSDKDYMLLVNHNNLLPGAKYQYAGVNGIKTGFTNRAGSCVCATCVRNNRTLLVVIAGAPSAQDRDYLAQTLFTWGFKKLGVTTSKTVASQSKKTSSNSSKTKSSTKK